MMNQVLKHDCKTELNEADLRATQARVAVMRLLENTNLPLDVATVKEYLDRKKITLDVATVFRTMNVFSQKGIVRQVSFNEGKLRYELANRRDHHHLICVNCGNIEDFSDCALAIIEKEIKKKNKFLVKNHSLEFFGACFKCQQ